MNEHDERRAARRQDLALLFADAFAAGYRPAPPPVFSEPVYYLRAHTVPGPDARPPAKDAVPAKAV